MANLFPSLQMVLLCKLMCYRLLDICVINFSESLKTFIWGLSCKNQETIYCAVSKKTNSGIKTKI